MKITAELIQRSPSYINPVKDRELDLRGNKIPAIENIGATKDLHDCIDFSNNDLKALANFPLQHRLRCILASNNRIQKIEPSLGEYLPNLQSLILTSNNIEELGELANLKSLKKLTHLSLLDNPVTKKKFYREWVIQNVEHLRVLDFQKVQAKERKAAAELFVMDGVDTDLATSLAATKAKTFEPGQALDDGKAVPSLGISKEEQARIREAIKHAKTLDEVNHLERMLRTGQVPKGAKNAEADDVEMEER